MFNIVNMLSSLVSVGMGKETHAWASWATSSRYRNEPGRLPKLLQYVEGV